MSGPLWELPVEIAMEVSLSRTPDKCYWFHICYTVSAQIIFHMDAAIPMFNERD